MRRPARLTHAASSETANRIRDTLMRGAMPAEALQAAKAAKAQTYEELIHQLAGEIDAIVLPRVLSISSDGQMIASVVVSNRRLVEMQLKGAKVQVGGDGDADPDTIARTYARALQKIAARSGPLQLRSAGRAPQTVTGSTACSAARLAGYGEAFRLENRMKAYLKSIHARSLGWIFRAGDSEAVAHSPDEAIFERLRVLDQQAIAQAQSKGGVCALGTAQPTCSACALSGETQAIVVVDGSDRLTVAMAENDVTNALEQWQQFFGRIEQDENGSLSAEHCDRQNAG